MQKSFESKIVTMILSVLLLASWLLLKGTTPLTKNAMEEREGGAGIDIAKREFEHWFQPGAKNPQEVWERIKAMPTENDLEVAVVNAWESIGPAGFPINYGGSGFGKYSGRILDIEVSGTWPLRLATASGGLWEFQFIFPVPLSDALSSLATSTVATKPDDPDTILVGTGESVAYRRGTGIWKTTDRGVTWTNVLSNDQTGDDVYRIRFTPGNPNKIHAVTGAGYFRSDDGGENWTRFLNGGTTDIAINPSNTNILWTAIWGDGVYKSTNGGDNWAKVTMPGIPTTNVGRTAISLCRNSPDVVYVSINKNGTGVLLGIYKTINGGTSWTCVLCPSTYDWGTPGFGFGGQGDYDNAIGVSPTNPNLVLAGFVKLYRTDNGGSTWTLVDLVHPDNHDAVHDDHHAITWHPNGSAVWVGTDGGFSTSFNGGVNWTAAGNYLPITQFYHIDIGAGSGARVIYGGAQDNGIVGTRDGGQNWLGTAAGDGFSTTVDPTSDGHLVFMMASSGGPPPKYRSTNFGLNWSPISTSPPFQMDGNIQDVVIRTDRVAPIYLYTNGGGAYVYRSTNLGTTWTPLNTTPFPSPVWRVEVSKYSPPSAVVYAIITGPNGDYLRVYDNGTWYARSSGFPPNVNTLRTVAQHPSNNNVAYALINGFSDGEKIYRTTNRGITWTNITGDLPDIPLKDLVPHPTDDNILFLGTEFGCFKTVDGGATWYRWNNGMPEANIITDLRYIDNRAVDGKFYIIAGTYGRSIWKREISGEDP